MPRVVGERNGAAKLKAPDIALIRKMWAGARLSQAEIARAFGCSQSNISLIVRAKAWKQN